MMARTAASSRPRARLTNSASLVPAKANGVIGALRMIARLLHAHNRGKVLDAARPKRFLASATASPARGFTSRRHSGAMRQHRTLVRHCAPENLEIPRCAIAHRWFSPDGLPRNDGDYDAVRLASTALLKAAESAASAS